MQIAAINNFYLTKKRINNVTNQLAIPVVAASSTSDTVSFGMTARPKKLSQESKNLLIQLSDKLIEKNLKMSKGLALAVRNEAENCDYYTESCENLVTTTNKLFSQSPDEQIVIFKKYDENEFVIEALTPVKDRYRQTIINIEGDNFTAKSGEKATLDSNITNTKRIKIQTKNDLENFNGIIQSYLSSFLTKTNTIF